jgi:hypothetical protein
MNFSNRLTALAFVMCLIFLVQSEAQCQTFNEWFKQKKTQKRYLIEQIAALQLYLKNLKQGYTVVKKGLNLVGEITGNSYSMDNIYLKSLLDVKATLTNSDLSESIQHTEQNIRNRLMLFVDRIDKNAGLITTEESAYLKKVVEKVESLTDEQVAIARSAKSSNEFQMTDANRIQILTNVKLELQGVESFLGQADGELTRLVIQRQKESQELNELKILYQ